MSISSDSTTGNTKDASAIATFQADRPVAEVVDAHSLVPRTQIYDNAPLEATRDVRYTQQKIRRVVPHLHSKVCLDSKLQRLRGIANAGRLVEWCCTDLINMVASTFMVTFVVDDRAIHGGGGARVQVGGGRVAVGSRSERQFRASDWAYLISGGFSADCTGRF